LKQGNIIKYFPKSTEKIMVHVEEKQHGIEILALSLACSLKQFATPGKSGRVVIDRTLQEPILFMSQVLSTPQILRQTRYSQISYVYAFSLNFDSSLSTFP
jgi:hypothetical protein